MLKRAIYGAVICLLSVILLSPTQAFAIEDTQTDEDVILYDSENTTTPEDDANLYDSEYDWESAWNELGTGTDTNVNSQDLTDEELEALGVFGFLFGTVFIVISSVVLLVSYVYSALTLSVTAKKLNVPNPWTAWVPFLNFYTMIQCAGISPWNLLWLAVAPVFVVYVYMKIAQRRGFEQWLGILMLVPIAQIIVPGYLAWGEPKKVEVAQV
ncbi:hypothetical protein HYV12_02885 [Candidatus Dojkabacteria bacterium]|nr:hypothetical protein [Candidatus Dojkabacteria bacterium]